ncbi:MAG: heavy metal-associated domain-containing protein [Bryobacteraceae bacterium]
MTTDTTIRSYSVTGMSCAGCAKKIAAALQNVPGVAAATVTLQPPEARMEMTRDISAGVLNEALTRLGAYRLTEEEVELPAVAEPPQSLYPLFLIVGYIAATVGLIAVGSGNGSASLLMNNFMAGFFLVFSFFKFLDLRGFSDAYRSYDLVARAVPGWGFVYPFVEFALGVAYLLRISPRVTNGVTLGLMLIGSLGVLRALLDKRAIRCACLGTAIKLPMTTVTLVEDLGMAAMAAVMLVIY